MEHGLCRTFAGFANSPGRMAVGMRVALGVLMLGFVSGGSGLAQERQLRFAEAVAAKLRPIPTVRGDDLEWYFPIAEIRHLAMGYDWSQSQTSDPAENGDPFAEVLAFHESLRADGLRLLFVPVPAKGSIYADRLVAGFSPGDAAPLAPLLNRLAAAGVRVLSLETAFRTLREKDAETLLYCQQDRHFTPYAASVVATLVAEAAPVECPGGGANRFLTSERERLNLIGDQVRESEWEGVLPPESHPVRYVSEKGKIGIEPQEDSPVVLIGDSHTLVYHRGPDEGMHCRGAGVLDHLAVRYGFAPDLVGVPGAGRSEAPRALRERAATRPDYWKSKQWVIWLFSECELTQVRSRHGEEAAKASRGQGASPPQGAALPIPRP